MKDYVKENIRKLVSLALIVCVVLVVSILFGITPKDVFQNTFRYEEETEYDIGVTPTEDLEYGSRDDLFTQEMEGEEITFEDFLADLPEFDGENLYVQVNKNRPFFTEEEKKNTETFIQYSELDELGRVGQVYANVCYGIFNTGKRTGDLSTVTPAGWNQVDTKEKFNVVLTYQGNSTDFFYCRGHMLAYALGGAELDPRGIATATVSQNMTQLQFEKSILDFLDVAVDDHVLIRVTPVYREPDDLIPYGFLYEAYSVESKGIFVNFNIFMFNAAPGFKIQSYKTGEVVLDRD